MVFAWILVTTVLATFVVYTAFLTLCTAKRMLAAGVPLPWDLKFVCYFWLLVGWPADVVYNWTRGTIRHRKLPRELTYSSRIQGLVEKGKADAETLAWANLLNAGDENHIRGV